MKIKLFSILRDPSWQAIAVIVSIVIAIAAFWFNRPVKSLRFVILSNTPLVDTSQGVVGDLEITYRGEAISHATILIVEIENNGNLPINREDYARDTLLIFPPGTRFLDVSTSNSYPFGIGMVNLVSDQRVELSSVLLNPGDKVVMRVVMEESSAQRDPSMKWNAAFIVDARISGIMDIPVVTLENEGSVTSIKNKVAGVLSLAIGSFLFGFLVSRKIPVIVGLARR